MSLVESHIVKPIGVIDTPFKEKFGIPRQPNLVNAKGTIRISNPEITLSAFEGIEQHSHLWILFLFDQHLERGWKSQVRPPRLGGNEKVGVFATRSTFRPNCIGMSVVKYVDIKVINGEVRVEVEGIDLLDGTPIVDIKPYIPYSDSLEEATSEMAEGAPEQTLKVVFSQLASNQINELKIKSDFTNLISDVLAQDPRPSYKKSKTDEKVYGILLDKYNIKWQVNCDEHQNNICEVMSIELANG